MSSKINEALLWVKAHFQRDEGQTMAEYGMLLALIAVVGAVGAGILGLAISGFLGGVSFP